jgi:hypothetical protein
MFSDEEAKRLSILECRACRLLDGAYCGFGIGIADRILYPSFQHQITHVVSTVVCNGRQVEVDSRFEVTRAVQEREVKKRPKTKPAWSLSGAGIFNHRASCSILNCRQHFRQRKRIQ